MKKIGAIVFGIVGLASSLLLYANLPSLRFEYPEIPISTFPTGDRLTVRAELDLGGFDFGRYPIAADDCVTGIRIDGTPIYSAECEPGLTGRVRAFSVPGSFSAGTHSLEIEVENHEAFGCLGLPTRAGVAVRWLLLWAAMAWFLFRAEGSRGVRAFAVVALGFAFAYSVLTPFCVRANDFWGHSAYIQYVAQNWRLPGVTEFWCSFHPPVYYAISAFFGRLGIRPVDLAFAAYAGTLVLFWRRYRDWLGFAMLAFFPVHLFCVSRVSNDVVMPLLGLFYLLAMDRLVREPRNWRAVLGTSAVMLVAVATKLSALSFVPGLLFVAIRRRRELGIGRFVALFLPFGLFLLAWMFRSWSESGDLFYMAIPGLGEQMRVPNGWGHFFGFSPTSFFGESVADNWAGSLRHHVLEFFLTSSLQGEFRYPSSLALPLFVARGILLVFFGFTLVRVFRKRAGEFWTNPAVLLLASQTAFYLFTNVSHPFSPFQDARYWAATFPAIAWLIGHVHENFGANRPFRFAYSALGALFLGVIGFFYLGILT
ncbi:MAG: hypothetical protein JST04_15535 [Bdellovibrionales bacterium]|nr:hypothetical protein [Bdellovibrionales bacterium]